MVKMWEDDSPEGMNAKCEWDKLTNQFHVTVTYKGRVKQEQWHANYTPTFGIDIIDSRISFQTAERLAKEFDQEEKLQ